MKKIVLMMAVALAFTSCKKENNNSNPSPVTQEKPFGYNKAGRVWVYDFVYNNQVVDSLVTDIAAANDSSFTMVTRDKVQTVTNIMYVDGDYLKSYRLGQTRASATRVGKHNAKKGESWMDIINGDTTETKVLDANVTVTVPAGSFNCTALEVKNYKQKYTFTNYVNDKSGLIKIDMGTARYELRRKNF